MTPYELFRSWDFKGVITWQHHSKGTIRQPVVMLFPTERGFLSVPPGYEQPFSTGYEREHDGPLETEGSRLVFPGGTIEDLEISGYGFDEMVRWEKHLAEIGRTEAQEWESYRQMHSDEIIEE